MCFSANASFAASAVLGAVGAATLWEISKPTEYTRRKAMFASIPLLFSVQQFSEGILWTSLENPSYYHSAALATYVFMFFAFVLWPTWVPLSIFIMEGDKMRKRMLSVFCCIGIFVSVSLAYQMLNFNTSAQIVECHIFYHISHKSRLGDLVGFLYVIATIVPIFLSSLRGQWILGLIIAASALVTQVLWSLWFASVWCYFSAIISIGMYFVLRKNRLLH